MWIRRIHLDVETLLVGYGRLNLCHLNHICGKVPEKEKFKACSRRHNSCLRRSVYLVWVVLQLLTRVLTVADALLENGGIHTFRRSP